MGCKHVRLLKNISTNRNVFEPESLGNPIQTQVLLFLAMVLDSSGIGGTGSPEVFLTAPKRGGKLQNKSRILCISPDQPHGSGSCLLRSPLQGIPAGSEIDPKLKAQSFMRPLITSLGGVAPIPLTPIGLKLKETRAIRLKRMLPVEPL